MPSKLSHYRTKRDFAKTAEPRADKSLAASTRRRFVVQKHAARHLHYDLRLELDGVFKSWAVTRGPSLNPRDKRLAVEVEDHPLAYGDFEGTIPKGQYGGGTVQIWDRGYWSPEGDEDPGKALASGELKFTLEGSKLHGSWVLVEMKRDRRGGKRKNWLLIKHRDAAATEEESDAILAKARSVASGRPMDKIAQHTGNAPAPFMTLSPEDPARQKPKAKALAAKSDAPTRMPDFIVPQLCRSLAHPPSAKGWIHEIKFDGYRVQLRVAAGKVTLKTRKGLDWTGKFTALAKAAAILPDVMIDGEIVALDKNGAPDFSALQGALAEEATDDLIFFAFDLLFEAKKDWRPHPLLARKKRLEKLLKDCSAKLDNRIRYVEHFTDDGEAVLKSACRLSLEGIVSKKGDAAYQSGRSDSWSKAKCRAGHDVVIGGWATTNAQFRSLLVGVHRGPHFIYIGRVGTGYGAAKVKSLVPKLKAVTAKMSPFTGANAPRAERGIHWTRPELVAEIEFSGWTTSGMVRQGAFKGLRTDKPADEVIADEPASPETTDLKMQKIARSPRKSGSTLMGVSISHADKILWPQSGNDPAVTKYDLARYFEAVADRLLPHVRGRPLSLVRAPDGLNGEQFFQRHAMRGTSSLLELVTIPGDKQPYLQIERPEGLIALAQIAAGELHPWNCAAHRIELPGRLVFDLDPAPRVAWRQVIAAAHHIRESLASIGLVGFCKTSGGKGLHVVAPLIATKSSNHTWPQAKSLAHELCQNMADQHPDLYVVNMSKKARTGRIFLDYLRNDRMATSVAPFSPRWRSGATVSMPLDWDEVTEDLEPKQFTIHTVPKLLVKNASWAAYGDSAKSLPQAIKRLGQAKSK